MTSAFSSLIEGTKSVKQAFADMTMSILSDLAKIIAKQLMLKVVSGFPFADGGIAPGGFKAYANGGIAKGGLQMYASGGIVRQPTLGLVGEGRYDEAIVPLPNGRSIPVEMTIAAAVQKELQNQKRAGGILNPMGVS
jgi:lambda family phage tail tape measure protein